MWPASIHGKMELNLAPGARHCSKETCRPHAVCSHRICSPSVVWRLSCRSCKLDAVFLFPEGSQEVKQHARQKQGRRTPKEDMGSACMWREWKRMQQRQRADPWGWPAAHRLCMEKGYWGSGSSQNHLSRRDRASGRGASPCLLQPRPTQCCCKPCARSICPLRSVQPQPASVVSSSAAVHTSPSCLIISSMQVLM